MYNVLWIYACQVEDLSPLYPPIPPSCPPNMITTDFLKNKQHGEGQILSFKTTVHKPVGDVTEPPSTIYYTVLVWTTAMHY